MNDRSRGFGTIGCSMLLGAVLAFPVGIIVGARSGETPVNSEGPPAPSEPKPVARDPHSSSILKDPYFLDRQRELVERLEMSCRQFGQYCGEAEQSRQRLDELDAAK